MDFKSIFIVRRTHIVALAALCSAEKEDSVAPVAPTAWLEQEPSAVGAARSEVTVIGCVAVTQSVSCSKPRTLERETLYYTHMWIACAFVYNIIRI